MIQLTSLGLFGGSTVTATGLASVVADSPSPSDFEIVVGKITSVGLYGGLNVSTTGLYSQSTFTPSTNVVGALAATESGLDTFAASGGVVATGSADLTESGLDGLAASGGVVATGSADLTESGLDGLAATGYIDPPLDASVSTGAGKTPFKRRMAATAPSVTAEFAASWSCLAPTTGALSIPADTPYCRGAGAAALSNLRPWVGHTTPQTRARLHTATHTLLPNCAAVGRVSRSVALPKYKLIYPSCGASLAAGRQGATGAFSLYEPRAVRNPSDAELLALIDFL